MIDTIIYYLPHAACLFVGGIVGFFTCAMMTMSKVADATDKADWELTALCLSDDLRCVEAEHHRIADALATKQARIDRALEQVTPGANATVQRIARILKGDA